MAQTEPYNTWSGRGPERWPERGAVVRLAHYREGNVLRGDQKGRDRSLVGIVAETPHLGSGYLVVDVQRWEEGEVSGHVYDAGRPESWSLTSTTVTLHRGEFTEWEITHVKDAQAQMRRPVTIEVPYSALDDLRDRYREAVTADAEAQAIQWMYDAAVLLGIQPKPGATTGG